MSRPAPKRCRSLVRRAALALLLGAVPVSAQAAYPCPYISFGWTTQWQTGTLQSAAYDTNGQVLYVVSFSQIVAAHSNVPLGVFQSFTRAKDPLQFYTTAIVPSYRKMAIFEKDNCPILLESGQYLWLN